VPIGVLEEHLRRLGIHMNWFFRAGKLGPAHERDVVVRAANRPRLSFPGLGITEELLSPNLTGALEMLISTIAPGADSENYSHDGAEAGWCSKERSICGSTTTTCARIPATALLSTARNSIAVPTPIATPTRVLWVITPRALLTDASDELAVAGDHAGPSWITSTLPRGESMTGCGDRVVQGTTNELRRRAHDSKARIHCRRRRWGCRPRARRRPRSGLRGSERRHPAR
jgi:hypothetical protein